VTTDRTDQNNQDPLLMKAAKLMAAAPFESLFALGSDCASLGTRRRCVTRKPLPTPSVTRALDAGVLYAPERLQKISARQMMNCFVDWTGLEEREGDLGTVAARSFEMSALPRSADQTSACQTGSVRGAGRTRSRALR
jgi:hypothetical protein